MQCRNSPLTRSPPANMAKIPGITCPGEVDIPKENGTDNIPAQKTGGKFKYMLYSFFYTY